MTPITITLPWPSRDLHPNARVHWARKANAAKTARKNAAWSAKAAGVKPIDATALGVRLIFHPPDRRRRDGDGMLSSCKAYIDGISDVVGVDDSRWVISFERREPVKGGAVHVVIEEAE